MSSNSQHRAGGQLVLQCGDARRLYGTLSANDRPNPGLLLGKFVCFERGSLDKGPDKKETLKTLLTTATKSVSEALKLADHRIRALERGLRAAGHHIEVLDLELGSRMIVGFGTETPLEVGITVDRLGAPYIPASSLKGLARYIAEDRLAHGKIDKSELPELFGTQERRGGACFYDAYPKVDTTRRPLELDVMNPHFPYYYREPHTKFPTDDQDPKPVLFVAVAAHINFHFLVSSRDRSAASRAAGLLYDGLTFSAAGAKKAAGYGWFIGNRNA